MNSEYYDYHPNVQITVPKRLAERYSEKEIRYIMGLPETAKIIIEGEQMKIEDIARICHEANKALCESHGDLSQDPYDAAPTWQKDSAVNGVKFHLDNPTADASASHVSWLTEKEATGWVYGEVKDTEKKTHPCIVPFDQLPAEQQAKDHLFRGIVHALAPFVK